LGLYTAKKLDDSKDANLISLLRKLLTEMKDFVKTLFRKKEIKVEDLPDNITLGDLSDLLAYRNSKIILPNYQVEYTTPDNKKFDTYQEASKHISNLSNLTPADISKVNLDKSFNVDKKAIDKKIKQLIQKRDEELQKYLTPFTRYINVFLWAEHFSDKIHPLIGDFDFYRLTHTSSKEGHDTSVRGFPFDLDENYKGFYLTGSNNVKPGSQVIKLTDEEAEKIYNKIPIEHKLTKGYHHLGKPWEIYNEFRDQISILKREKNKKSPVVDFIEKNRNYEASKKVIDKWKEVNNIQYNPEEVYSRGQGFYSSVGAYSSFDVELMFQNLLSHIEDNKKAGGEFTISAYTKPINKRIKHLEGFGSNIRFVIYPKPQDIKWAASSDVHSGSVWDASKSVSEDTKSELIGISYTKSPSKKGLKDIKSNLADIIDKLNHAHNELGIELTGSNFRLEYDSDIPYSTKSLIDNINKILDQKFGKIKKPKYGKGKRTGIKPTQIETKTVNEIMDSMSLKNKVLPDKFVLRNKGTRYNSDTWFYREDGSWFMKYVEYGGSFESEPTQEPTKMSEVGLGVSEVWESYLEINPDANKLLPEKEVFQSQAEINAKIGALKLAQRKYPRSLIRSKIVRSQYPNLISKNIFDFNDELPFQLVPGDTETFNFPQAAGGFEVNDDSFTTTPDTKQQELFDKLKEDNDKRRDSIFMTAEELLEAFPNNKNIKLLTRVKDGLVRNQFYDEAQDRIITLSTRPSDFGQLLYAKARRYDKDKINEENNSPQAVIMRGMGTTLHGVAEVLMNELDRQNLANGQFNLLRPELNMPDYKTFFEDNWANFYNEMKQSGSDELKDIISSLEVSGKNTNELEEHTLIDPTSDKKLTDAERKFTYDDKDFKNVAELVFKTYYNIYRKQAELSWHRGKIGKVTPPIILTEATVIDKENDIMGSIDVAAIFTGGKVGHYDYKFISFAKQMRSEEGLDSSVIENQKAETWADKDGTIKTNTRRRGLDYVEYKVQDKFRAKKEAYNAQVNAYKNMLINAYGVPRSNIVESRIIPVNVVYKNIPTGEKRTVKLEDGSTKEYDVKTITGEVGFLDHKDKLMSQIALANEMTGDPRLDRFMEELFNEAKVLEAKLERRKNDDKLRDRLNFVKSTIGLLQTRQDIRGVANKILELGKVIDENLHHEPFIEVEEDGEVKTIPNNKYLTFQDLNEFEDMMTLYSGFLDASRNELERLEEIRGEEEAQEVKDIILKANDVMQIFMSDIHSLKDRRIIESAEGGKLLLTNDREIDITVAVEDLHAAGLGDDANRYSKYSDVSAMSQLFTALSEFNHPHLRLFKEVLDTINLETKNYVDSLAEEIREKTDVLVEWGKSVGKTGTSVYDDMIKLR
jgi:hypothetical protein